MNDVSHSFPLHDCDRSGDDVSLCRTVVQELAITEPRTPSNDSWARVPLRISHNTSDGVVMEIGRYDFAGADFEALEHAVKEMRWILDHN